MMLYIRTLLCIILTCQVWAQPQSDKPYYYPSLSLDLSTLGDRDYFFSKNQKLPWLMAASFCRHFDMDLAAIESEEENRLIGDHLAELELESQNVMTGGHRNVRGELSWLSGRPIRFSAWAPAQPRQAKPGTPSCVVLGAKRWAEVACDPSTSELFLCEQRDYNKP